MRGTGVPVWGLRRPFLLLWLLALTLVLTCAQPDPAAARLLRLIRPLFPLLLLPALLGWWKGYSVFAWWWGLGLLALLPLQQQVRMNGLLEEAWLEPLPEGVVGVRGRVLSPPLLLEDGVRFQMDVPAGEVSGAGERVWMTVKGAGGQEVWEVGAEVEVGACLTRPVLRRNGVADPLARLWREQGITALGFCKSPRLVEVLRPAPWWGHLPGGWRRALNRVIAGRPEPSRGLYRALLLGDRGGLDHEVRSRWRDGGVSHLLAISGFHVGLVLTCVWFVGGCFLPAASLRTVLALGAVLFFVVWVGSPVSAVRAGGMAALLLLGRLLGQRSEPLNVLGLVGWGFLCLSPLAGRSLACLLSMTVAASLLTLWSKGGEGGRVSERPARWELFLVGGCAALPLLLHGMGHWAWLGLLLTPPAFLLTGAALVVGLLAGVLAPLTAPLAGTLLDGGGLLLDLTDHLVSWGQTWAGSGFHLRLASPWWVVLFLALWFLLLRLQRRQPPFLRLGGILAWAMLVLGVGVATGPGAGPSGAFSLSVLDVGQGDAQLVGFPDGTALLLDGGGFFQTRRTGGAYRSVLPLLEEEGWRVRWMAVSHFHPDHVRGLGELLPILKPEEVWLSARQVEDPEYRAFMARIPPETEVRYLAAPWFFTHAGCSLRLLRPSSLVAGGRAANADSQVWWGEGEGGCFLLMGDLEAEGERALMEAQPWLRKRCPDVLKVGHHGSANASGAGFLDWLRPRRAWISCGVNNSFGFPHPDTLSRLRELRIPWQSTARQGLLRVAFRGREGRAWSTGTGGALVEGAYGQDCPSTSRVGGGPAVSLESGGGEFSRPVSPAQGCPGHPPADGRSGGGGVH